jgi:hypothetical protein
MVGQAGINCCSILDNFRKKALGAYWLLLEPAPTCALFAGLPEGASALILPPISNPFFITHTPSFVYLNAGAFSGSKVARMFDRSLDRNSLLVFSFGLSVTRSLQFYSTTLRVE